MENIENNWRNGQFMLKHINCRSENSKGFYCFQYDEKKIVTGSRNGAIKIWDRSDSKCIKTLTGHTRSGRCLQYDDKMIISCSSDSTIRIWDVVTVDNINTLIHHVRSVLSLRFNNRMLITSSKVWLLTLESLVWWLYRPLIDPPG